MEPAKFNFVETSISIMQIISPIPSDPLHPTYNAPNIYAQAEYLTIVKMALQNCINNINFLDTFKMRRVHGDLMNEVSCEAQYIHNKHNI